jgi:hypothetical protein
MNWNTQTEDKLENLPSREHIVSDGRSRGRYRDRDFPWAHFWGFLEAHVGQHIDTVIHNFVNCDWCPARHRTASKIADNVELNTFLKDGKVFYFSDYCGHWSGGNERCVDDEGGSRTPFYYISPTNRVLKVAKKKRYVHRKEVNENCRIIAPYHQLCKRNGIWFEVNAEIRKEVYSEFFKKMMPPSNCERKSPTESLVEDTSYGTWRYRREDTRPYVKIVKYRQLNHKDLKKHNLKNDPMVVDFFRCPTCGGDKRHCQHEQMKRAESRISRFTF